MASGAWESASNRVIAGVITGGRTKIGWRSRGGNTASNKSWESRKSKGPQNDEVGGEAALVRYRRMLGEAAGSGKLSPVGKSWRGVLEFKGV